ncbi:MAG TPA: right-handed parallel beta-helix repeat-containing protein, partial [Chloroflexia bacterium]|nr:right-handed parallel beta-helix repeat-containing protein [Chloroflexia bacterium]
MTTIELQNFQERDRMHCATGAPAARRDTLRTYIEAPVDTTPGVLLRYYVNPDPASGSSNANDGLTPATAFRTVTHALRRVPFATLTGAGAPSPTPSNAFEINLMPGGNFYTAANEAAPPSSSMTERGAYFDSETGSLILQHRVGSATRPIIIQGYSGTGTPPSGSMRPRLQFRLNFGSVQYVYLKNLRVDITSDIPFMGNVDAAQFQTLTTDPTRTDPTLRYPVPTHHILIRNCDIFGGGAPGSARSHEVLKVNQCQHVYVESCQIHGAFDTADGANSLDFVAVQYGHIVDCDIYDSPTNWCIYVKGGSAYYRIEGNRIHNGQLGFSAGEGTTCDYLVRPWWHYEAYAIQFVNNLVYDTSGTGVGVYGGYDILVAHNVLYNVGTTSQMIALAFGRRHCANTTICEPQRTNGAWATTRSDDSPMIPNRYLYIYNNVLLVDSATSGFNIFDIAGDIDTGAGTDPSLYPSNLPYPPRPDNPATSDVNESRMLSASEHLDVRGNFVGVARVMDVIDQAWFVNAHSTPRSTAFRESFRTLNRSDGAVPELNTGRSDLNNFLRPASSRSNVLESNTGISKVATPPGPPSMWLSDLPPAGTPEERPAPWATYHNVYLDQDKLCRGTAIIPGAHTQPVMSAPMPTTMLRVVEVGAPAINYIFDSDGSIVVDDSVANFVLANTTGDAFLQSRTSPVGEAGTP